MLRSFGEKNKSSAQGYPQANGLKYHYVNNYYGCWLAYLAPSFYIGHCASNYPGKGLVFTQIEDLPQQIGWASGQFFRENKG